MFVVTGFEEPGPFRLKAIHVAEDVGGELQPSGRVEFGFAGRGLWQVLDQLRESQTGEQVRAVTPTLSAKVNVRSAVRLHLSIPRANVTPEASPST